MGVGVMAFARLQGRRCCLDDCCIGSWQASFKCCAVCPLQASDRCGFWCWWEVVGGDVDSGRGLAGCDWGGLSGGL